MRPARLPMLSVLTSVLVLAPVGISFAFAASFTDVPPSDQIYSAVEYLKGRGMISGYADGTYRADNKLNRVEALAFIAGSKLLGKADLPRDSGAGFSDVSAQTWFAPYVAWAAVEARIIDDASETQQFHPGRIVKKAEFLKMLLLAHGMDKDAYGEIRLPLAPDESDVSAWHYPFCRLAIAMSVTQVGKTGYLGPERDLTRGDVALFLYRLLQYKDGERVQALLESVEEDALATVRALNAKDVRTAEYASARALLAARGALTSMPDESLVKGALKLTEAYRALVRGYRALTEKRYEEAIGLSKDSWFIADKATELSPSVASLAVSVKTNAELLAADARAKR
ncbi:MAG: S-layer homology domain-containing protein [Candidatus Peribacteraceae bacterium]|nr:S-layer homology domain-containing protein [Candidatus Peribacteraceae bacterium]